MNRKIVFTAFLLFVSAKVLGQNQTVKGYVLDAQASYPLAGATVTLLNSDSTITALTDDDGIFRIFNVPIGRQAFLVEYIGYKNQTIPNVLVTSGKEVILHVMLQESVRQLEEIVITRNANKDQPINDLAKVSARTFSIEEINRYSGGRNDVARLASSFAGVSTPNDARNDIVVRGNSPTALLWRINGIPVSNVNHFSTLGTTGGPVSALNTNILQTSDFITGAFPAEYGNANGAVFDVGFRDGNKDEFEFTGQLAAFTGLEFMAEGPISKKNGSSFLISYRYGIAATFAPGTSGAPRYQDLAFKLDLGKTFLGNIELFGMGGTSSINFLGEETDADDLFANPNEDQFVKSRLGLLGLSQEIRLNRKSYIKNTVGFYTNQNDFLQDNLIRNSDEQIINRYRATEAKNIESRTNVSTQLNTKFSARTSLRAGAMVEFFNPNLNVSNRDDLPLDQFFDNDNDGIPDRFFQVRDTKEPFSLLQAYAQGEYKFTDDISVTGGIHTQYLDANGNFVAEPRLALSWQFKPNQRLSLAYGLHSQMIPFPILFLNEQVGSLNEVEKTNLDLTFMRSHHYILGYDRKFGPDWRLKTEVYYQSLFDIPIETNSNSSYSVINEGDDFVFDQRSNLVNEGTGFNYGLEITLEKFFSKKYYGLLTTSLYQSRYKGADNIERNTAFNSNYVINALLGKEWQVLNNKKQNIALTFDMRFSTSGGRPYTPIDVDASIANNNNAVENEALAFSQSLDPYLRLDIKIGYRINSKRKKYSMQFFVDLQNVTNRRNQFIRRYNEVTQEENVVEQIGFFPDVLFRIQF